MRYLIVDAYLNGTGIRDKYEGGYIEPEKLQLSSMLCKKFSIWLEEYQKEFFEEYKNEIKVGSLDKEGKELALLLKQELRDNSKIEYYSDAKMISELI